METQNKPSEKDLDWESQLEKIESIEKQIKRPSRCGLYVLESLFIAIFLAVAVGIYFTLFKVFEMQTECEKNLVVAVTVLGTAIICALGIMGYVILSNAAKTYKSEMDVYNKFRQSINDMRIKSLK